MDKEFKIKVLGTHTGDGETFQIDENTPSPEAEKRKIASFPDYCEVIVQRITDNGVSEYTCAPKEIWSLFQEIA